jgi:hypothetical protein
MCVLCGTLCVCVRVCVERIVNAHVTCNHQEVLNVYRYDQMKRWIFQTFLTVGKSETAHALAVVIMV